MKKIVTAFVFLLVFSSVLFADVNLPSVINDHMVLQRNSSVPIWGWADPDEKIKVKASWLDQSVNTQADSDGNWSLKVDTPDAGGPYTLIVGGKNEIELNDVMVGEVWVCSGQSNMEWHVQNSNFAEREIKDADKYSNIRLFTVPKVGSPKPLKDCVGSWSVCSSETIPEFSAVAYFFGKSISDEVKIPIGLIHSSWGGSACEAWMRSEVVYTFPYFAEQKEVLDNMAEKRPELERQHHEEMRKWYQSATAADEGMKDGDFAWQKTDVDDMDWKQMEVPEYWEQTEVGNFDGIIWFRKHFELSASQAGKKAQIELARIDDMDIAWINGVRVGAVEQLGSWNKLRQYEVPQGVLKAGDNIIAVRVMDTGGGGGFHGKPEEMKLTVEDEQTSEISLAGPWKYKIGGALSELPTMPSSPITLNDNHIPTYLYNGMIAPIIPYGIRGAIWYQGEFNAERNRSHQYRKLFPTMITNWRVDWGQGNFPFYFVQLANFKKRQPQPGESNWAELREAQLMTLKIKNTGMAVTIDIGEAGDIHPRNKQDVGKRLALWALAKIFNKDVVYSGPLYKLMEIDGDKMRIHFDHMGTGLMTKGDELKGFAVAGEDRQFVWAEAVIDGNTVVVSSPNVSAPAAVRYAWADNPPCNLYNKEGLPASPFRTDDWPGITE